MKGIKYCCDCKHFEVPSEEFPCNKCIRGLGEDEMYDEASTLTQYAFENHKKVIIAQFFEELSQFVWNFIDNVEVGNLTTAQCKELMDKISGTFISNTDTNKQFVKYHGRFFVKKIIDAMEEGDSDDSE